MVPRSLLVDGLKVVASQLIVLHHMLLYAPMADVVRSDSAAVASFLAGDARFVVQIFLVIGGYLAAQGLERRRDSLARTLLARYLRLVPMLAAALLAVLAASALLPAGHWPEWVTPWPTLGDLLAHLLLLQDVLRIPSLSAGAWYVSIDFQLYALLAVGATVLHRRTERPVWQGMLPWAVAALTLASLLWINRDAALDVWAPYFFGAYGMGVLAAWAGRSRALTALFVAMCALQLASGWLDARPRVLLAALTALALASLATRGQGCGRLARLLATWSDASYGVFLIHYAVIVATTALWLQRGPGGNVAAWATLGACWAASLAAGMALQRYVGVPLSRRPPGVLRRLSEG